MIHALDSTALSVIQMVVILATMFLLYFYWGYSFCKLVGFKCHFCMYAVIGFIFDFFIYLLVEVPFCVYDKPFDVCAWIHIVLMVIYTIISSIVLGKKGIKFNLISAIKNHIDEIIIILVVLGIQLFILTIVESSEKYQPDATWDLSNITTIISTNSLYRYGAITGRYVGFENPELIFYSLFPYIGTYCCLFNVTPIMMYSDVFASFEIMFYYLIAYGAIRLFFNDDEIKSRRAYIIYMILNMVYSARANSIFIIYHYIAAKVSIAAGIFIPMTVYMLMRLVKKLDAGFWPVFLMLCLTTCCVSRTGNLSFLIVMGMSFIPVLIKRHEIGTILKYILSCMPALITSIVILIN